MIFGAYFFVSIYKLYKICYNFYRNFKEAMIMKKIFKVLALTLCAALVLTGATTAFAGTETPADVPAADIDYKINSTYENVDFGEVNYYKGDLHSHTTLSDGNNPLPDMVERHYELGFDILAITDHGTAFYGYTDADYTRVMKVFGLIKNGIIDGTLLSQNGTAANGNAYKVTENAAGDEFYSQTLADGSQGQQMLAVPYGNEQNPTSFNNAHVNTWFVDWGHGRVGGTSDYATPIKAIEKLGGLSVINHPGEYTNARDEESSADAYNKDNLVYNYKITKFESLLLENKTCLGIDINSKGDSRTRYDRKLWDIMLQDIVPHGRSVYAIATTDAHNLDIVDSGYTVHLMKENTSAELKANMAAGEFFAASKYIGNIDEMTQVRDTLVAINNPASAAMIEKLNAAISSGDKYFAEPGTPTPKVTDVAVNESEDTITVRTENAHLVRWIANGKVIAIGETIDLDDYSNQIGSYVRAEVYGDGGVLYTQAFTLEYDGAPEAEEIKCIDFGYLVTAICDVPVRILLSILPLNLIAEIFG